MTHDDEYDDDGYNPSEDTDATIRRLESEILRLSAEVDQLAAGQREYRTEMDALRATMDEVERTLRRLEALRRRDRWLIPVSMVFWAVVGTVLANLIL